MIALSGDRNDEDRMCDPKQGRYEKLGLEVGALVDSKQAAYGDSFGKAGSVMRILYPEGVTFEKLDDALTVVRVLDKLFRVATDRDALGESPWRDVAGYALLATQRVEVERAAKKDLEGEAFSAAQSTQDPLVVSPRARMLVEKLGYAPAVAIEIDSLCTRSDEAELRRAGFDTLEGNIKDSLELVLARARLLKAMREMAPGVAKLADGVPTEQRGDFGSVSPEDRLPPYGSKFGDGDMLVPDTKLKEDPFPTVVGDKTPDQVAWRMGSDGKLIPSDPNTIPLAEPKP